MIAVGEKLFEEIYSEAEERMNKVIAAFQRELAGIRAGRASPTDGSHRGQLLRHSDTFKAVGQYAAPEPRLLVIQPWDRSSIPEIEKAILKSDLGLTPTNDGTVIRLSIRSLRKNGGGAGETGA